MRARKLKLVIEDFVEKRSLLFLLLPPLNRKENWDTISDWIHGRAVLASEIVRRCRESSATRSASEWPIEFTQVF